MSKFFKIVLGSCLGVILSFFVIMAIAVVLGSKLIGDGKKEIHVEPNSVLVIDFKGRVPEQTNNIKSNFLESFEDVIGLSGILRSIEVAKNSSDIKGIIVRLENMPLGMSNAEVLRNKLIDFKSEGKFVYAYGNMGSKMGYYVGSVADKIVMSPLSSIDLGGFKNVSVFFKNALEKAGLKFESFYVGKYKGASEAFRLEELSKENKEQIGVYLGHLFDNFLTDIGESRNISKEELFRISDDQLFLDGIEETKRLNLIDEIGYYAKFESLVRVAIGLDEDEDINMIDVADYASKFGLSKRKGKDKIAVLYAEGSIVGGDEEGGMIAQDPYLKMLRKIRNDKYVKGLVVRINSGGGSALVSDLIWNEIELIKEKGIPVVASMGDVAASGGYYIACNADTILAEPTTITGSIGVVGGLFTIKKLINDKLGISTDTVKTTRNAVLSPMYDLNEEQKDKIQGMVNNMYQIFIKKVSDGRNMSVEEIHEIAQGRVWTGIDAKRIGLVDKFGGLDDAIEMVANMAGVSKFRLSEYPKSKDKLTKIMEEVMGGNMTKMNAIEGSLKEIIPNYETYKLFETEKTPLAISMFNIDYN